MGNSYTSEEKRQASQMSTVSYLQQNYGFTFHFKNNYYKCQQHDSLIIYPDERGWVWNSKGMSGGDVIDFIQKIENKSYADALDILLGKTVTDTPKYHYASKTSPPKQAKHLQLPEKAEGKYSRVFAYLHYTRRISKAVIDYCFKQKVLYQDKLGNCVFVGYNKSNEPVYGAVRGTLSDVRYRGDCSGSDKHYGFCLNSSQTTDELYVFESPIDAMSHCTIANLVYRNDNAFLKMNRLSLGGLSTVALEQYLSDHPEIKKINFCLDNDYNAQNKDGTPAPNHGQEFAKKCCQIYAERGYTVRIFCPKYKDFNEDIINYYVPKYSREMNTNENKTTAKRN